MNSDVKNLIEQKDNDGLRTLLAKKPQLANEGITIPFDTKCKIPAHPLHRICDCVFSSHLTDEEVVQIARIFLDAGADVNGAREKINEDTPLLAAASLHAEKVGILYIENGADIHYKGRHDGATAIHWAAYCGKDKLVQKLIEATASIDQRDTSYNSPPLGWAIQPLRMGEVGEPSHHYTCIQLLLKAGADISALNDSARMFFDNLKLENSIPGY